MIGISSISSYVPSNSIDNVEQAKAFGESDDFIEKKIGAKFLPQIESGDETSDIACKAVKKLLETTSLIADDIDALIVITQNGDGQGLPHTAAIVQHKLGLQKHVAAFDISLGCSGYVYGLSVLRGLMMEAGLKNGVLVTADPYSKVVSNNDRITSMLFGDAATASWLCEGGDWKFGKPLLQTDGSGANSLFVDERGTLQMNGRQVFNFASKQVPIQIKQWLLDNGKSPEDIDSYVMHQGSLSIVDVISRRFPSVSERFVKDIEHTGNTVSSSIPLLLEKYIFNQVHQSVLICGFGVGLSWATNMLYKEK